MDVHNQMLEFVCFHNVSGSKVFHNVPGLKKVK